MLLDFTWTFLESIWDLFGQHEPVKLRRITYIHIGLINKLQALWYHRRVTTVSSLAFPCPVACCSCYPASPGYAPLHSLTHHSPSCVPLLLPIPFLPGLFTTSLSHPHLPAQLHTAHLTPPHISTLTTTVLLPLPLSLLQYIRVFFSHDG